MNRPRIIVPLVVIACGRLRSRQGVHDHVHANGRDVLQAGQGLVDKAADEAGLAHGSPTDDEDLLGHFQAGWGERLHRIQGRLVGSREGIGRCCGYVLGWVGSQKSERGRGREGGGRHDDEF